MKKVGQMLFCIHVCLIRVPLRVRDKLRALCNAMFIVIIKGDYCGHNMMLLCGLELQFLQLPWRFYCMIQCRINPRQGP